jgi:alginate O-acetyltransferase complex protein AlgI
LFPTADYLLFLPVVVLLYWSCPPRLRLPVLAVASAVFYASWSLHYLPVLLGMALLGWLHGLLFAGTLGRRRVAWLAAVASALLPLLVFKYWDWIAFDLNALLAELRVPLRFHLLHLALPVGISFFTFQALAYMVDTRAIGDPERSPLRFWTFLASPRRSCSPTSCASASSTRWSSTPTGSPGPSS